MNVIREEFLTVISTLDSPMHINAMHITQLMGKFEDYIIQNQNLPLWRLLNFCDLHVITAMWSTRHTVDTHKDKDLYIKTTLRELVIYLLFLAILCAREYS